MSGGSKLHPWVVAAADGELPKWAVAGTKRREHMAQVAKLLKKWSKATFRDLQEVRERIAKLVTSENTKLRVVQDDVFITTGMSAISLAFEVLAALVPYPDVVAYG